MSISQMDKDFSDVLSMKFPLDNKFNYMIIDANLGIKENLNNIFFIEFDLQKKEKLKIIREINNDAVDRELFFRLNGYIHNTPLFTNDLKFSVETRKFIKSIQFKLDKYKNELIQDSQLNSNNNNNQIQTNFFAKVLSNTNLGIEFFKPCHNSKQPENFMTNFNSIVNSKIVINKLFLEVCIPKIFLNNGLTLSTTSLKNESTNKDQVKDIEIDQFKKSQNENMKNNNSLNNQNLYSKSSLKDKPIKIPPLCESDFKILKEKLYNSPSNQSFQQFYKRSNPLIQHNYFSPDYFSHPTIFGRNNLSGINTTNSSSVYFSPNSLSYYGQNYYLQSRNFMQNFQPLEFDYSIGSMLPRRLSENSFDKFNGTPLSYDYSARSNNYNNNNNSIMNFNLSNQTNLSVRSYGRGSYFDEYNIGMLNRNYLSPKSDKKIYQGIPTIHKKIMDWEKTNKSENEEKEEELIKENIQFDENNETEELNKQAFIENYDGLSNFLIFLRNSTPYISKREIDNFKESNLKLFFSAFTKMSLFGFKVIFLKDLQLCETTFTPSISSFEIIITNKDIILEIIDKLIALKVCTLKTKLLIENNINSKGQNEICQQNKYIEFTPNEKNPCFKIIIKKLCALIIEYYENKPPHLRKILIKQLEELTSILPIISNIGLKHLFWKSFFSVLYTPLKSQDNCFLNTSFITYYQFKFGEESLNNQSPNAEIPIIGILPIKLLQPQIYLQKINQSDYDNIILNSSIQSVNKVFQNSNKTSIDVEYYLKNLSK